VRYLRDVDLMGRCNRIARTQAEDDLELAGERVWVGELIREGLADQIIDQNFYEAAQLVFSSASSKTAYGTAAMLKGHTSPSR